MKPFVKRSSTLFLSGALLLPFSTSFAAAAGVPDYRTLPAASASSPAPISAPVAAAVAKAKLSKDQALQIATRMISLPEGVELQNAYFRSAEMWRPFPEWSFSWVKKAKNNEPFEISVNIGVNANTGEITSYSSYEPAAESVGYASQISREEAIQAAERFIAQINPAKAAETMLYTRNEPQPKPPLGTNVYYNFHYARMVGDIMFPENGLDITVNGSGKVTGFSVNWDDALKFDKPVKTISTKEALEQFRKKADVRLSYFVPWENRENDNFQPFLGYSNPFTLYLDAASGKMLTTNLKEADKKNDPIRVSNKPLPSLNNGGQLDQDEAVKLAQKLFELSKYQLKSINYNENDYRGKRSIWNLQYEAKDQTKKEGPGYLSISLDAKTGDIYSFYKDKAIIYKTESNQKGAAVDQKSKAIELFRKFTPSLASQFYLHGTEANPKNDNERVFYQFQRYVNGVQAGTGNASVMLDAKTGELLNYNVDFGKEKYPSQLPKHISSEKAVDAWLKEADAELVYVFVPFEDDVIMRMKLGEIKGDSLKRAVRLVYRMSVTPSEQPYVLDAVTEEWRSQNNGKLVQLHRPAPSDIAGHPAEKELMLMYEYDAISLIDGKIMPERQINRGEMIEMLMMSLYQGRFYPQEMASRKATYNDVAHGSRYFASVEAAVDRGLLDKSLKSLKPDEPINREELADMLVRALGLKKLSKHTDMFQSKLEDIGNSNLRGAITIVTSLGIMDAENNRFNPAGSVSRSDAAVSFYRFLEKRGEVEDKKDL